MSAKRKRESRLLTELQNKHGYMLKPPDPRVDHTEMVYDQKTRKMSVSMVVRFLIPVESALGVAFQEFKRNPPPRPVPAKPQPKPRKKSP